ncbi:hypothetical protein AB5I41_31095 [Sphingomonas sp. MMS24-JH45]
MMTLPRAERERGLHVAGSRSRQGARPLLFRDCRRDGSASGVDHVLHSAASAEGRSMSSDTLALIPLAAASLGWRRRLHRRSHRPLLPRQ